MTKDIEKNMKDLTDKLSRVDASLKEINRQIHDEQLALADALAHGSGNPGRHQSNILKLGIDADSLRISQAGLMDQYQTLRAEMREVERAEATRRLAELEQEYGPAMKNIQQALRILITEEVTTRRCYTEAQQLIRRFGLSSDINLATIAIGSASLADHSESCLGVIKRNCPSFYQRE